MEISKRLEGSKKQTNLSMNEHLNITPIQIILSYQAQPQTNNLDKLENPNTPPHKNEYQSPPRNPINPTSRTHTINHYREHQKARVHKLSNTPPLKIPARILGKSLNHWPRKFPKIMMITTTRKSGPGDDVRGQGESSTPKVAGPDGRVLHHKYGVL